MLALLLLISLKLSAGFLAQPNNTWFDHLTPPQHNLLGRRSSLSLNIDPNDTAPIEWDKWSVFMRQTYNMANYRLDQWESLCNLVWITINARSDRSRFLKKRQVDLAIRNLADESFIKNEAGDRKMIEILLCQHATHHDYQDIMDAVIIIKNIITALKINETLSDIAMKMYDKGTNDNCAKLNLSPNGMKLQ